MTGMRGSALDTPWAHRLRWRLRSARAVARRPVVWRRHRGLNERDVFLAEHPKSGGTWLAFMLGELLFGRPIDFESQRTFMPAVGSHDSAPIASDVGGRLLRTHERRRPEYSRGIYLVRHAGDVAVSYYNWLSWLGIHPPPFKDFLSEFLQKKIDGYGPWPAHVESWARTSPEGVLVVRYEDLRAATDKTLRRVLTFLGIQRPSAVISAAIENNSLERTREKEKRARETVFRNRDTRAVFVRKGSMGDWRDWLDGEDKALLETSAGPALQHLGYTI